MPVNVDREKSSSGSLKYILALVFLSVAIPAAAYALAFVYDFHSGRVSQAIKEQESLFVFHTMTTSYLFGLAGLVFIGIYVVIENIWTWIAWKPIETFLKKFLTWCGYGAVFCMFSMIFGAPVFNWFWHDHFESQGYSSCSGVLPLRTEIFYSVWVRNSQWCEDPEVSRILREEGHGRAGVDEVNEYLEENHVEGAREGGDAPVPPLRGSGRTD